MSEIESEQTFSVQTLKLDATNATAFLDFARTISAQDSTPAFSEQTLVEVHKAIKNPYIADSLLLALAGENDDAEFTTEKQILGAVVALLDTEKDTATIEGAVASTHRGQGIGTELARSINEALSETPIQLYNLWVHQIQGEDASGERKAAELLARSFDYSPVRELRKLQLWLTDEVRQNIARDLGQAHLPEGTKIDTFKPGMDDAAWLSANAEAFANHPEQGSLTAEDLNERKSADWFRAEGFFVARADEELAGFHWTKIPSDQGEPTEGEVYAVGIVPSWQGKKLGKILTLTGMDYLAQFVDEEGRPLDKIVLYVDADNTAAVSLYKSLGFVEETVDIMYSHQA